MKYGSVLFVGNNLVHLCMHTIVTPYSYSFLFLICLDEKQSVTEPAKYAASICIFVLIDVPCSLLCFCTVIKIKY